MGLEGLVCEIGGGFELDFVVEFGFSSGVCGILRPVLSDLVDFGF